MLAILILRFTSTRTQEEHFGSEVNAARDVQQYLIPETIPSVRGLDIKASTVRPRSRRRLLSRSFPTRATEASHRRRDVAGHGLEAGMLATLLVGAIRTRRHLHHRSRTPPAPPQ